MLKRMIERSTFRPIMLAVLFSASIFFISGPLYAQEEEIANYGRIRYAENGITLIRSGEGITEEGTLNAPIFPGDSIETGRDQRAEIQLADSSYVRLDHSTRLDFQALSDLDGRYEQSTILKLFDGDLYIEARNMDDKDKNFQVDTPFASVYLLTNGRFRINVNSEQRVEVYSYSGVAEVVGEYDSVLLRSGKMTFLTYKSSPADPRPFNSFYSDGFDSWNDERDELYSSARVDDEYYDDVPYEVKSYYPELSYYGGWVHVPVYGYVWYPYGTYAGWRPYYDGYWHWGPRGYVWVSYEPWGWAPYHYGRWSWVFGYGWVWIPGSIFGNAWVAWSYCPTYIGWCPLDYWDRPAFININLYLDCYDFRTWNFIHYRDVTARNVRHAVLRQNVVEKELKDAVVGRHAPKIKPKELSENQEARKAHMREVASTKERVATGSKERTPASLPTFKEHEKSRSADMRDKIQDRASKSVRPAISDRKGTRTETPKSDDGNKRSTVPRGTGSEQRDQKRSTDIPQKQTRSTDQSGSPLRPKQETMKSYPKQQDQDRTKERTVQRDRETMQQREPVQEKEKLQNQEMRSYPRKDTDDTYRNVQEEQRIRYRDDSSRTVDRERSQREAQSQQRNIVRKESREDSNSRLQKMLKDMSQTPRTHEIQKRETQQRRETPQVTTRKKQDERSSSSGESRKSSGSKQSGSRESKGRK